VTVSKEITRLDHSRVKLAVSIGKEDVRSEYDEILTNYSKNVQVSGFRKGKVPKNVLERKLGDAFKDEVLSHLVEHSMRDVFGDEHFPKEDAPLSYSTPKIESEPKLDLNEDFVYTVIYDVFPQFTIDLWKGFEVEVPDVCVSEEDINRELELIRDRNAVVLDKDDSIPASKGDVVTVNYSELTVDDSVDAGTEREGFVFTIGTGRNTFKFDDDLVGMKKGEAKDIEKTFPEDFEDKDLAGKTKKIRVSITNLKEKKLPELDDELAQDVDERYKTLDDLKKDTEERLSCNLERRLKDIKVSKILEKIIENTPIDLPDSMIRIQLDAQWRNFAQQINMPVDQLKANLEKSEKGLESFEELWRPEAIRALHSRLIIEILIKDLNLESSDTDVKNKMKELAEEGKIPVEEIKEYYEKTDSDGEKMIEYLKEDIREGKLFNLLLAENTVKTGNKESYIEIMEKKVQK
jgi:trigger factor